MLEIFTASTFSAGDRLSVLIEDAEPIELEVTEVAELEGGTADRAPFSVLFVGPGEPLLPQRIYSVAHPDLGPFDLFLVPLGPTRKGGVRYEAVFT